MALVEDAGSLTPPQRRVYAELLAVDQRRPAADPALVARVRDLLEERTALAAQARPAGARGLRLNKTALGALDCDGRYLDHRAAPFSWSLAASVGTLAHRAVTLDQAGRRRAEVGMLVDRAWANFGDRGERFADHLATLTGVEADALRAEAADRVIEFRECFPLLPSAWAVRLEPQFTVRLHGGALELLGKPDLALGRLHPSERRLLLVDLKTGRRNLRDRADMRFYALLAMLKYGSAPFRVATYYLDEADWDAEDVDGDTLEAAARGVAEKASTAARLTWAAPADPAELRLVPGPACRWCGRAPGCPAVAEAERPLVSSALSP